MHDAFVLFLEALQLVGDLGPGRSFGTGALLRAALRLFGGQPIDLTAQGRGLVLGVSASRQLFLQPLVLVGEHAARLFGGAVVADGRVLELGQPLAHGPPTGVDGGRYRNRVDRQDRRRRRRGLGAFPLREELV